MTDIRIRAVEEKDREWAAAFIAAHWGSDRMVSRGRVFTISHLPGFIAEWNGEAGGYASYHIDGDACELTSLDSLVEGIGIGQRLIAAVREAAVEAGCRRLFLITTNDNVDALRFYQKRGFTLAALYPNAVAVSRQIKPEIPMLGSYGIPIRDEIELEMLLISI